MLGDSITKALDAVGVTEDRVTQWLGVPCRCAEYREKLNALELWARRVAARKFADAKHWLERMLHG